MTPLAPSTAGQLNIAVEENATFNYTLTWKDGSSSPFDLTGFTAWLQVRSSNNYLSTVYLDFRSYDGGTDGCAIVLGGPAGTITITGTAAVMTGLTWKSGKYDLFMVSPEGIKTRLVEGWFTVYQAVTENV